MRGDAGTWTWEYEGRQFTDDNPVISADRKAKKLRSLLERQKAIKKLKGRLPFIEVLAFCSAEQLQCNLTGNARYKVCLRDRDATAEKPQRQGIMAALMRRECPGLDPHPKGRVDRPIAKAISQAMEREELDAAFEQTAPVRKDVMDTLLTTKYNREIFRQQKLWRSCWTNRCSGSSRLTLSSNLLPRAPTFAR